MRIRRLGINTVILALTVIVSFQERAPAAAPKSDLVVYESRRAYTVFEDQVLEGRRSRRALQTAAYWVVPVLLPKDPPRVPNPRPVAEPDVDTTVIWEIVGRAPGSAPDVIVDDLNLGPAEPCPGVVPLPDCLTATFSLSRNRTTDAHHHVQLVHGPFRSPLDTIVLRPMSPFVLLLPTFRHDRCENCHALQRDADRTIDFHAGFGVYIPPKDCQGIAGCDPSDAAGLIDCGTCHLEENTGVPVWGSPHPLQAPDFRSIGGDKALCEAVIKSALHNKQQQESLTHQLQTHFHGDERIEWAIVNGWVPLGFPALPTAPPHDVTKFREFADRWLMSVNLGYCKGLP